MNKTKNYDQFKIIKSNRDIDNRHVLALMKCNKDSTFDFATLKEKVTMLQRRFVKCPTIKEYLEMIEEIYNYKNSKNIIKLT